MPPFETIAVPVVLAFTAAAAWGDLRPMLPYVFGRAPYSGAVHGRIPNRLLLVWLAVGALLLGAGYLYYALGGPFPALEWVEFTEGVPYAVAVLVNALAAFGIGFVLWYAGLWAAGDAKTFALIAFTLPLSLYADNYLSWFPSFALFFNSFVALFLILLAEFLVQTARAAHRTRGRLFSAAVASLLTKIRENKLTALRVVVLFLAIFTLVRILRHFVREGLETYIELNKTVIFLLLFLMFRPLMRLAARKWALAAGAAIIAGYAVYAFCFDPTGEAKWEFINIGWLAISLILFRAIYDAYLKATDELAIPCGELRKGMILADVTVDKFKERKQFYAEKLGDLGPDGLTQEQAQALRQWFEENEPEGRIFVSRTIPFVPALLVGTLLTVLCKGLVLVF
jgi:hypothetical protein